jgi:hypothetical protein
MVAHSARVHLGEAKVDDTAEYIAAPRPPEDGEFRRDLIG